MPKFVLRSIYQLQSEKYLKGLFRLRTKDLLEVILIFFCMSLFVEEKLEERRCDLLPQNSIIC